MATWPESLPQLPNVGWWNEKKNDNTIRVPMGVGPPQQRARVTKAFPLIDVSYYMTRTQVAAFETFYDSIGFGSTEFDGLKHPRTLESSTFTFASDYTVYKYGLGFKVSFTLQYKSTP